MANFAAESPNIDKIMNRLFVLALSACLALSLHAQENKEQETGEHVFYKVVPESLKLQDKIMITNKSPYHILQIVVALVEEDGMKMLGSATSISPNETWELASYSNNWLKNLKGKTIAIKAKAAKISTGYEDRVQLNVPFQTFTFHHKELDPDIINSIKPEDITYEFDAKLYEERHDLYIELFYSSNKGIMDF